MDDLLREFLTETNESLDVVDVELVRFEQDPNNAKILDNIFRLVHTIKGTCGFLGLPRLEALAHAAETLMGKFRDGLPVTGEAVTLILATIDRIKEMLEALEREQREPEGADDDLIVRAGAHGRTDRAVGRAGGAAVRGRNARAAGARAAVAAGRGLARRARARVPRNRGRGARRKARQAGAGRRRRPRTTTTGQGRQPVDPRQCRHARTPDDHGVRAGADAQPAARDRAPPRGFRIQGAAAAALERHRRAAGRRHEDAHAADRQCLAEAAAHRARSRPPSSASRSSSRCTAPRPSSTARCSI